MDKLSSATLPSLFMSTVHLECLQSSSDIQIVTSVSFATLSRCIRCWHSLVGEQDSPLFLAQTFSDQSLHLFFRSFILLCRGDRDPGEDASISTGSLASEAGLVWRSLDDLWAKLLSIQQCVLSSALLPSVSISSGKIIDKSLTRSEELLVLLFTRLSKSLSEE